jgi:hypothetical protein
MSGTDYIPSSDPDFDQFQENLYSTSSTNAATWNIPTTAIGVLTPLKKSWDNAWADAKDANNRTRVQTKAKDDARDAYEPAIREFVQGQLIHNTAIASSDLKGIGLKRRDGTRTSSPVPTDTPLCDDQPAPGFTVEVNFRPETSAPGTSKRAKPKGIDRLEINGLVVPQQAPAADGSKPAVPAGAPKSPADCNITASSKKSPLRISFDPSQAGSWFFYFPHWVNSRNENGPIGPMHSIIIPS